jgi:hypothetical protein
VAKGETEKWRPFSDIDHFVGHPAVEDQVLAGEEAVGGIGEKKGQAGGVSRNADTSGGMLPVIEYSSGFGEND